MNRDNYNYIANKIETLYGCKQGELQARWRQGKQAPDANGNELEWAICDALLMGGIIAYPGDGVGCVARIVEHHLKRAEAAEAENARLREALEPFAEVARADERRIAEYEREFPGKKAFRLGDDDYESVFYHDIRMGHYRRARAALDKGDAE
jgi:hypothetical protein